MYRIIFQIGPITLYSYGFFVAIGFLLSTTLILRKAAKLGMSRGSIFDCLIVILAGGLIGGRLLFVIINWAQYAQDPLRIIMLHEGGLAFQGALTLAILAGAVAVKIKKLSFLKTADLIVPYAALAQAIGRIGCFFNGCCYGGITEKGIGVKFPLEEVTRIPAQLYSSLSLFVIFLVLIALRKRRSFDGYIFSMYIVSYSIFRFLVDFIRGDNPAVFCGMTLSQIISLGTLVCGTIMYIILRRKGSKLC